jgi:hypothetical protein
VTHGFFDIVRVGHNADGALYTCAVAQDGTIVAGGASGRVHFLRLEGAE